MQLWIRLLLVSAVVNFLVIRNIQMAFIAAGVSTAFAYLFLGINYFTEPKD